MSARDRIGVGILFLVAVTNLLDRQIIYILSEDIKTEFSLTDAQLGLLSGPAFGLIYVCAGLPLARFADRGNRVGLLGAMLATWSAATVWCGQAGSFVGLWLGRMGVGAGQGAAQATCASLVSQIFPADKRSTGLALLMFGVPLGTAMGFFLGGIGSESWGWRMTFLLAGVPGLLLIPVLLAIVPERRNPDQPIHTSPPKLGGALWELARLPALWWLGCALAATSLLANGTSAWLPSFFVRTHGYSLEQVGTLFAWAIVIGGGAGALSSGYLCDRLRSRFRHSETAVLMLALSIDICSLTLIILTNDIFIASCAMFSMSFAGFAWMAPIARLIQDAAGPLHYTLAVTTCSGLSTLLGRSIGLPLIGVVSDSLTEVSGQRAIGDAMLLVLIPCAALGLVAHWQARRVSLRAEDVA